MTHTAHLMAPHAYGEAGYLDRRLPSQTQAPTAGEQVHIIEGYMPALRVSRPG